MKRFFVLAFAFLVACDEGTVLTPTVGVGINIGRSAGADEGVDGGTRISPSISLQLTATGEPLTMRGAIPRSPVPNQIVALQRTRGGALQPPEGFTLVSVSRLETLGLDMITLSFRGRSLTRAIEQLRATEQFVSVQPNFRYVALNTASARKPTAFENTGFDVTRLGRTSGTIAMIDGAVDISHPEFGAANLRQRIIAPEAKPSSHGTAVASLLVGGRNVTGTARGARVLSFAALKRESGRSNLSSRTSWLAEAIDEAARANPSVITMSLGGARDPIVERLVEFAHARGILVVAAAGNGGSNASPAFPAAYPQVIAVTAVNPDLAVYARANRGSYVEFSAPGVDVLVADKGGAYDQASGTSFAAAIAAGILHRQRLKTGSPTRTRTALQNAALDLGSTGLDPVYGHGLLRLQ